MNENEKQQRYKSFRNNIADLQKNNKEIDSGVIADELLSIKNDVASSTQSVRTVALETLEFLATLRDATIDREIVKLFIEENGHKTLQKCIAKSLKINLVRHVEENSDILQVMRPWLNQKVDKLLDIFEDACTNELPKRRTVSILMRKIIPHMMNLEMKNDLRNILIEVALRLTVIVTACDLTPKELEDFQKDISNKYIICIVKLRDQDYPKWYKMWIFIIKFCDKWMHSSLDLTNKLLRVVEFAFRNNSINQRSRGYDCWKALIDNAGLDSNYISSSKQIKLLVTPLKAKFSKQVAVISKRFNVFCYLMYKLQQKAIACLPEFLDFCFGPVGDDQDPNKVGQGKTVPELWPSSTRMLMGIIGHTHPDTTECLPMIEDLSFEKPIMNSDNFQTHYKIVIRSVRECSVLLKDNDLEGKRDPVLKCMWLRIFELIKLSPEEKWIECFKMLSETLEHLMQKAKNQYFQYILVVIALCLLSCDRDFITAAVQHFLPILLRVVLDSGTIPTVDVETLKDTLSHSFTTVTTVDSKIQLLSTVMGSVLETEVKPENAFSVGEFWICVANELVLDLTVDQLNSFKNFQSFFAWPVRHLHLAGEPEKKKIMHLWPKLYKKVVNDSETRKQHILTILDQMFDDDSVYGPNIICVLNHISQAETKFNKEFVNALMKLVTKILESVSSDVEYSVVPLLSVYFTLHCYKENNDDNITKSICTALKVALIKHKCYRLLDPLCVFLKASSPTLCDKFSSQLLDTLSEMQKGEEAKSFAYKEIQKVIQICTEGKDEEKKTFKLPTGRSARIAHLGKVSPKSPIKANKSASALRLFGKDIETMSPLKVKGSLLNNSPQPKPKTPANVIKVKQPDPPSLNDESSSQFVLIDTEVKLQPQKMNEHQKEMLKRKREDIPALYQDLSQSQSQDMFSSKSNSNSLSASKDDTDVCQVKIANDILMEENAVDDAIDHFKSSVEEKEQPKDIDPHATQILEAESEPDVDDKLTFKDLNSKAKSEDLFSDVKTEITTPITDMQEKHKSNEDTKDKTKKRVHQELSKLRMDIVGADEFSASRRLRVREKPKEKETTKPKNQGSLTPKPRQKTNDESTKQRRKTISEFISVMSSEKTDAADVMRALEEDKKDNKNPVDGFNTINRRASLDSVVLNEEQEQDMNTQSNNVKVKTGVKRRKSISEGVETSKKKETEVGNDAQESFKFKIVNSKIVFENGEQKKKKKFAEQKQEKTPRVQKKGGTGDSTLAKTNSARKKKQLTEDSSNEPKPDTTTKKQNQPTEDSSNETKHDTIADTIEDVIRSVRSPESDRECAQITELDQTTTTEVSSNVSPDAHKGEKRKALDDDLEDVIQSSQESCGNITNLLSTSKKQRLSKNNSKTSLGTIDENTEPAMSFGKDFLEDKWMEIERAVANMDGEPDSVHKVDSKESSKAMATDQSILEDLDDSFREHPNQDSTITQDSTLDSTNGGEPVSSVSRTTQDTLTQTQEQETPTQTDFMVDSEASSKPTVLYLDLPKKPQLTDSEQIMCRMDTMSICTDLSMQSEVVKKNDSAEHRQSEEELEIRPSTPPKDNHKASIEDLLATPSTTSIPSSPVTMETPSRTIELLDNTIDISPINSQSTIIDSDSVISKEVPVAKTIVFREYVEDREQNPHQEIGGYVDRDNTSEQYSSIIAPENLADTSDDSPVEIETEVVTENIVEDVQNAVDEVPGAVDEAPNAVEEVPNAVENVPNVVENTSSVAEDIPNAVEDTPNAVEDAAMIAVENVHVATEDTKDNDVPERTETSNGGDWPASLSTLNKLSNKNIIKRRLNNKRIMSPSTGRIKLLMSNLEPKTNNIQQEDIDEEDILTFTREIPSPLAVPRMSILKRKMLDSPDTDGVSPCAKRKRVNFSDPCLTSKKIFIKDDYPSLEVKRLFDPLPDSKTQEEYLDEIIDVIEKPSETETEVIETEPSMDVLDPTMLRNDCHIYPALANCNEDVMAVLKKVTSPMLITTMWKKVQSSNIKTIGDLARLSEAEVNRFPFKAPVVANVYKALDNYYKKKVVKEDPEVAMQYKKMNGSPEELKKSPKASRFGKLGQKHDTIPQEEEPEPVPQPANHLSLVDVLRRSSYQEVRNALSECMYQDLLEKAIMPAVEDYIGTLDHADITKLSLGFVKSLLEKCSHRDK